MANNYGISDAEFNVIKQQANKRAEYRQEFLKQRQNPWKHAAEAGYVFDPAVQKFLSMKDTQFDHFKPNPKNSIFGIATIIIPMFAYGYCIYTERNNREEKVRRGETRYRDRLFKLS